MKKRKEMSRRHLLYLLLLTILCVLPACMGCTSKKDKKDDVPKGRYCEKDFKLPEYEDEEYFSNITSTPDGMPILFTYQLQKDNKLNVRTYTYKADGTFTKEEPDWLSSIDFDNKYYPDLCLREGSDGTFYLLVSETKDDYRHGTLYTTKDGKKREKIDMEGWDDFKKSKNPKIRPSAIGVLDNKSFVVDSYDGFMIYSADGKITKTFDEDNPYSSFKTLGNQIVGAINQDGEEIFKGVAVLDGDHPDNDPVVSKFDTVQELTEAVNFNLKGDVIFVNSTGICLKKANTDVWQTVADGSLGSMYIPYMTGEFICADAKDNYYVMYYDYSSHKQNLIQYYYDKDMPTTPDKTLSVYTLNSSHTLRKAANAFQKTHPNVKVDVEVAMPEETEDSKDPSGLTKHDYIQNLNTKLLAGDGCDLINLNELPIDSYIEKGALLDLTDWIKPVYKSKDYLNNVIDTCRKDDKLYFIPARINLPMLYGSKDDIKNLTSLADVATYAKTHPKSKLFGEITSDDLLSTFLPLVMNKLMVSKNKIDEATLSEFLENLKVVADQTGLIDQYDDDHWSHYVGDLFCSIDLYAESTRGIGAFGYSYCFYSADNDDYSILNQSFTPTVSIGINSTSKQKDLAKEFLETLLSEPVQNCDMEDGFPVMVDALNKMKFVDGPVEEWPYQLDNGKTVTLRFDNLPKDYQKQLIEDMSNLNSLSLNNDIVYEAVAENTKDYFAGKKTLDETVALIQNKLSIYTEE